MNPPPSRRGPRFIRRASDPAPEQTAQPASINIDLVDAIHRAERAEAEVENLTELLRQKEEILNEARSALRHAKRALQDHLRDT